MARTGLFAGSFDPPTLGHLDLITRALDVVDRLVVAIGANADKSPWLEPELRRRLLNEIVPAGVEVSLFDGLAVAKAREVGASVLIRGVRGPADLASELAMARANRRLDPGVETILLPASQDTAHISSRLVREVHRAGGDASLFVPEPVVAALAAKAGGATRHHNPTSS